MLVLDEPLAQMDERHCSGVMSLLEEQQNEGLTFLITNSTQIIDRAQGWKKLLVESDGKEARVSWVKN